MKDLSDDFINNRLLKLYLIIQSMCNSIYLGLEIYKSKLAQPFVLKQKEFQHSDFVRISNISNIGNIIIHIMTYIAIIYLIILLVKKHSLKQFFIGNIFYLVSFTIIGSLCSKIFSAPIGNLIQSLFSIYAIVFITLVYYLFKIIRNRFLHRTNDKGY